jgi:hypothetical protein
LPLRTAANEESNGNFQRGRIEVGPPPFTNPSIPTITAQGHADNQGNHFALTRNHPGSLGRSLIIGSRLPTGTAVFDGGTYLLQGNTMSLNNTLSSLHNLNGSTLSLDSSAGAGCATLTVERFGLSQDLASNTLAVAGSDASAAVVSTSCSLSGGKVELGFADVFGQPLTLRGFATWSESGTEPTNLLNLLWIQNDTLGLVLATRDQERNPHFEGQILLTP